MKLDLSIQKNIKRPVSTRRWPSVVKQFLHDQNLDGHFYMEILLVGNTRIQTLNKKYRKKDAPTDVLSFPMSVKSDLRLHSGRPEHQPNGRNPKSETQLGSIVICPKIAFEHWQEGTYGTIAKNQVMIYLIIHGLLHLLGEDHATDAQYDRWEKTITQFWLRI